MRLLPVSKSRGFVWLMVLGAPLVLVTLPVAFADEPKSKNATGANTDGTGPKTPLKPGSVKDRFDFETDQMKGTIRLDGAYHGVTRLLDKRTGRQVIDSRYSALNLFRLMSVNRVMGEPRSMERTTTAAPHRVEVKWVATNSHKAEITARYEVVQPNAIDVTVKVRSQETYAGYELFMSSYFDKVLRPHVYLRPERGKKPETGTASSPVVPTVNDVFRGTLLVFPRDAHSARRGLDGRWAPRTIQLCPVRHYSHCVAFVADPDNQLGVVLMSHPRDCYALSTRYHAEDDADRLTAYSAFDLSLFGGDLLPRDERTVKVRLALTELDKDFSQPLELYRAFIAEGNAERNQANQPNSKGAAP